MADITLFWTDKILCAPPKRERFEQFAQHMANRLAFGEARYGATDKRQKYVTRMAMELAKYKRTGNAEHLYNIANYCVLETIAPENQRYHHDGDAPSATRD